MDRAHPRVAFLGDPAEATRGWGNRAGPSGDVTAPGIQYFLLDVSEYGDMISSLRDALRFSYCGGWTVKAWGEQNAGEMPPRRRRPPGSLAEPPTGRHATLSGLAARTAPRCRNDVRVRHRLELWEKCKAGYGNSGLENRMFTGNERPLIARIEVSFVRTACSSGNCLFLASLIRGYAPLHIYTS